MKPNWKVLQEKLYDKLDGVVHTSWQVHHNAKMLDGTHCVVSTRFLNKLGDALAELGDALAELGDTIIEAEKELDDANSC